MQLNQNKLIQDFLKFSKEWENTEIYNEYIYNYFEKQVSDYKILKSHCDFVSKHFLGYGENAFRYLWALVISQIPNHGKFLEIGVYKGSILALSQLISKQLNTGLITYGLTPLDTTGDKYSMYNNSDFEYDISFLYHGLDLSIENTTIIQGLSTNKLVKTLAKNEGPYDAVYIDGGHNYNTVINDLELCNDILKSQGLLIMDDASSLLNISKNHKGFLGHHDVGVAIRDWLDGNKNYKHLFACGHNRVWKKL